VSRAGARPRVFVTRRLPGSGLEGLRDECDLELWPGAEAPPREELLAAAARSDGLLCLLSDRIDAALLERATRLRVLSSCSVGLDHVDLVAATARGLPVGHTPGVLTDTTAELTIALLFAAARRVVEADRFVREGRWREWSPELMLGRDLSGATLGVIGLGATGRAVAQRARALGMRVLGWNRTALLIDGLAFVSLPELLAGSDFVSVHVALTPETRGLLDAAALAQMRPGAVLVNVARGGIVDEAALAAALLSGRLAGAALDVFAREPLPPESPLLAAPNLVLTPHIGSASVRTRTRMADLAVENLRAGLRGERMPHCANPEVYESEQRARKARGETT
jgi:glyoxylate reductase